MPEATPSTFPNTGQFLGGRYTLKERIGEGGMAVVYRAVDERLGRTVAVKIFRGDTQSSSDRARRESETRLLASLNHHSLVTLFDAHLDSDDGSYLIMEYVDGPTLRSRLARGPIGITQTAAMARDLAEALHVVHHAGVVHRDIKPSNVLLRPSQTPGEEYRATLADFGIAYLIDSTRITTPGALIGTAAYLSPEQVLGEPPAPASDIYSLGLVLLESLTGERTFTQTTAAEVAVSRLNKNPEIPAGLGYGWKSLLSAMTARNAQERPTALEVVISARALSQPNSDPEATGLLLDPTEKLETSSDGLGIAQSRVTDREEIDSGFKTHSSDQHPETAETARMTMQLENSPAVTESIRPKRIRLYLLVALLAVVVAGIAIAAAIWVTGLSAPDSPEPVPSLPPLTEPLNSDMKQLLDSVTP